MKLFGSTKGIVVLVCDRLSTYKKLARELAGKVILQWCWAHQRRSFIDCAAGRVRLRRWCQRWIERIAELYRLNDARLKHYDRAHPLERLLFRTLFDDGFSGLFHAVAARISNIIRSLPERRAGAHSV